jgi:hypothetical protein
MIKKIPLSLVVIGFALALLCTPSFADTTFDLTTGNSDISGFAGPYATVDVHLVDSTDATITFTSLTNNGNIYLMGDGGTVGVNVDATSWTLGSITGSNAGTGFTPGAYSDGGSGNEDGFGSFNQKITSDDGFTHSSDTVTFSLVNTGGTWADSGSVLIANSDGNRAAAHIFVTSDPANASNGALVTGFASEGAVTTAPEPASITLLGLGLIGVPFLRRRK